MHPSLSVKQVQLDGIPVPDEDDASSQTDVAFGNSHSLPQSLHDPKANSRFNKSLNCTHLSKSESDGKPTTQIWL